MHGLTHAQRRWKKAGRLITKGAMVGQFLLAGLLMDHLIRENSENPNDFVRALAFLLAGYSAYSGKERLLSYFNSKTFEGLADIEVKQVCREAVKAPGVAALKVLNYLWSVIPSLGFAYLTEYSQHESANFLRSYKSPEEAWYNSVCEVLAQIVEYPASIALLASCSFVCNILSFPGIHQRGLLFFSQMVQHLFASKDSLGKPLQLESRFVCGVNPLVTSFNDLMKLRRKKLAPPLSQDMENQALLVNSEDTPESLRQIIFQMLKVRVPAQGLLSNEAVLNFYEHLSDEALRDLLSDESAVPASIGWSKLSSMCGLGAATLCAWGLSNFYRIGYDMSVSYLAASTVLGALFMLSMVLMSMNVGVSFERFCQQLAPGRHRARPQILTPVESEFKTRLFAAMMAVLGGAPNIYQSLVMVHQPLPTVIASEYSSSALEYGGFDALTRHEYEHEALEHLIKEDLELARLYRLFMRMHAIDAVHPSAEAPYVPELVPAEAKTASCWAKICLKRDQNGDVYMETNPGDR